MPISFWVQRANTNFPDRLLINFSDIGMKHYAQWAMKKKPKCGINLVPFSLEEIKSYLGKINPTPTPTSNLSNLDKRMVSECCALYRLQK